MSLYARILIAATAAFSFLAPLRAEPPQSLQLPTNPAVRRTLDRALRPLVPGIISADLTQWTPEELERLGIAPEDLLTELAWRGSKSFTKRLEKGKQFQEKYLTKIDEAAQKRLELSGSDLEVPQGVLRSYIAFLRAQKALKHAPLLPIEIAVRARQDTENRYGGPAFVDWNDPEVRRYFQKRENKYEQEELPRQDARIGADGFEIWRAQELKKIEKAISQNYQDALRIVLKDVSSVRIEVPEEGVASRLGRWVSKKIGLSRPETGLVFEVRHQKGKPQVEVLYNGQPVKVRVKDFPQLEAFLNGEDSSKPWVGALSENAQGSQGAVKRLDLLNQTLSQQYRMVSVASSEDPPQKLHQQLKNEVQHYVDNHKTTASMYVSQSQNIRFGKVFSNLIWSGHAKGKNHWRNRESRARKNPFAQTLSHSLSKKPIREGFFKVMLPFILAGTVTMEGGKLAYEEGYLDPAIERGTTVAMQAVELADEAMARGAFYYSQAKDHLFGEKKLELPAFGLPDAPGREFRPEISQDGKQPNPFMVRSHGNTTLNDIPPFAFLPTADDLQSDLKVYPTKPASHGQKDFEVRSAPRVYPDGLVPLVLPEHSTLLNADVAIARDSKFGRGFSVDLPGADGMQGYYLETQGDYKVLQTKDGIPVLKLGENLRDSPVTVVGNYKLNPSDEQLVLIPRDRVLTLALVLAQAGFTEAAQPLVEAASHPDSPYMTPDQIEETLKKGSLYSYHPPGPPNRHVPSGNPFSDLTGFLHEGKFCTQCSGAGTLLQRSFELVLKGEDFKVEPVVGVLRQGENYVYPPHARVGLSRDNPRAHLYDSTPSERDPRAPEPLSPSKIRYALEMARRKTNQDAAEEKAKKAEIESRDDVVENTEEKEMAQTTTEKKEKLPQHTPQKETENVPSIEAVKQSPLPLPNKAASVAGGPIFQNGRETSDQGPRQMPADHRLVNPGEAVIVTPKEPPPEPKPIKLILPNEEAIEALEKVFKKLFEHPYTKSLSKTLQRGSYPSDDALRITRALLEYARTGEGFEKLRDLIEKLDRNNELPSLTSEDDLKNVLAALPALVEKDLLRHRNKFLSRHTRNAPQLVNPGYAGLIVGVFEAMTEKDWKPEVKWIYEDGTPVPKKLCTELGRLAG